MKKLITSDAILARIILLYGEKIAQDGVGRRTTETDHEGIYEICKNERTHDIKDYLLIFWSKNISEQKWSSKIHNIPKSNNGSTYPREIGYRSNKLGRTLGEISGVLCLEVRTP